MLVHAICDIKSTNNTILVPETKEEEKRGYLMPKEGKYVGSSALPSEQRQIARIVSMMSSVEPTTFPF